MRRPHFFELFTIVNLAAIALVAWRTLPIAGSPIAQSASFALAIAIQAAAGVAIRAIVAAVRRERAYLEIIRTRAWLLDTLRLVVFGGLLIFTYGWIKLVVPLCHPGLYDQTLWDFDRILFFGMSPNVFFLDLFGNGAFLRAIDWLYAKIFYVSTVVSFAFFLSHASRRVRIAFANGNAALWIVGAWLYMLVPSLGPAFRFPDLWFPHAGSLQTTQTLQALLMHNYQQVLRAGAGVPHAPIRIIFGIAAFPSLHVAFQTYVFLWMRRLWKSGEVLFALFALTILLGSIITGWHYLVDGLAGIALAFACWWLSWNASRMTRWVAMKRGH